jgi:curved DNA-binding protein CbpA
MRADRVIGCMTQFISLQEEGAMQERDHYEVLQVHPEADPGMILQAYWHLTRKYKLSMASDPSAARAMEELNRAFDVLGCTESRVAYDKARKARAAKSKEPPERETRRVSIEVSFWDLPAWQGIVAAAGVVTLAVVALLAGAHPLLVLAPTAVAIVAALLVLPRAFVNHRTFCRRWPREMSADDLRASTARIIRRWRQEHNAPDRADSLIELMTVTEPDDQGSALHSRN